MLTTEQPFHRSPEDKEFAMKRLRVLSAFKGEQYHKVKREDVADDPKLLGDKEIMVLAVSILDGDVLRNAPEYIRDDAEIVFQACTNIHFPYQSFNDVRSALPYASQRLKSDAAFIRRIVENIPRRPDSVEGIRRNVPKDVWEQVQGTVAE
ncbi:MAG: hypothetical protein A2W52_03835 [Candidatus Taylorbacteria bacterium RIFCSPHIGHO2_02_49_25]|uniref:Uncharacterized protein n=1 Tax=Candidatus Taylorbacteria bacterium RIFCSPHIGHO2_02_49_25 TaxID=1802305 RepID=A0A1G2MHN9_9BACT|nr:MAG: hypothetical protein A2759_01670 [Candidatus Taylorbacteria bacterium RIFCSPHIGHO2_01_FULL_49_60]OHA22551.1 MAG: hypothetical protein A2W52_03835 [Candidatus Taylorbacteria bacterium RIFCSPHIGHO2_02_49_25]OHA36747.1 MAG: hypothetical protein A2W65_01965 [Candidatus Taylorbacteria bacterium RIFCSPLOWO2_02_50_13]OHA42525.1 MAG: hypothetical protein A3H73_04020 [Candidatus Taylorbacteria bacterium RIFCSPLOWO2_02_FULL_50_120]HCB35344.1 hypothetical protein [Candidatus Taylorbacteria bacteri